LPTIFTHSAFAFGLSKLAVAETGKRLLIAASMLVALPDVDALLTRRVPFRTARMAGGAALRCRGRRQRIAAFGRAAIEARLMRRVFSVAEI
jgi:hypothetical protein